MIFEPRIFCCCCSLVISSVAYWGSKEKKKLATRGFQKKSAKISLEPWLDSMKIFFFFLLWSFSPGHPVQLHLVFVSSIWRLKKSWSISHESLWPGKKTKSWPGFVWPLTKKDEKKNNFTKYWIESWKFDANVIFFALSRQNAQLINNSWKILSTVAQNQAISYYICSNNCSIT